MLKIILVLWEFNRYEICDGNLIMYEELLRTVFFLSCVFKISWDIEEGKCYYGQTIIQGNSKRHPLRVKDERKNKLYFQTVQKWA